MTDSVPPNRPGPSGLRYGGQGPVTITLGALPKAAPPGSRPPEPPAFSPPTPRREPARTVLGGSLIPGSAGFTGPLPPPPARPAPPPSVDAPEAPQPAAEAPAVAMDTPGAASEPAGPAPNVVRTSKRRPPANLVPWLAGAAAVAGVAVVAAVLLRDPTSSEPKASVTRVAEADQGAPPPTLPSEQAYAPLTTETENAPQIVAAPVRVVTRTVRPTGRRTPESPAAVVASSPPAVAESAPPPPAVVAPAPAPESGPVVVEPPAPPRPRPPADPDAPFTTAPPGVRPDRA